MRVGASRARFSFLVVLLGLGLQVCCGGAYSVVQVTELVRHGSASPAQRLLFPLPKDGHEGWTTANGLRAMYLLGAQLKKAYPSVFDASPAQKQFRVFSATAQQCSQSANSHLLGLFPPGAGKEITVATDSKWVRPELQDVQAAFPGKDALPHKFLPFDLGFQSALNDRRFLKADPESQTCPGFKQYLEEKREARDARHAKALQEVSDSLRAAGFDSKSLVKRDSFSLGEALTISGELEFYQSRHNALPPGVSADLRAKVDRLATVELLSYLVGDVKQAVTNSLGREVAANLKAFAEGKLDKKALVYVGEAPNLLAFYAAFGLASLECLEAPAQAPPAPPCRLLPQSAESLIFELSKQDDRFFVRSLVNGAPLQLCSENQDTHYCKLEDFLQLLQAKTFYQDDDLEVLCQNPLTWDGVIPQPFWYTNWVTITGFIILALFIILLLLLCFHSRLAAMLAPAKPKYAGPPEPKFAFMKYTEEDD